MDLAYSPEQIEFRERARAWLAVNVPKETRPGGVEGQAAYDRGWQRRLYDGGWAGLNWPKEYGGLALSGVESLIWFEECERVDAPQYGLMLIALTHAGPTIIARGS